MFVARPMKLGFADLPPPIGTLCAEQTRTGFSTPSFRLNTLSAPVNPPADNVIASVATARRHHPLANPEKVYPLRLHTPLPAGHPLLTVTELQP